jgi:hypothetical protein
MNLKLTEKALDRLTLPAGKAQLLVWDEEMPGFGVVIGRRVSTFSSRTTGRTAASDGR